MICAPMFLYNRSSIQLYHILSSPLRIFLVSGILVLVWSLCPHPHDNNTFIAFLLTLCSSTRDALRLAGDLHDRRRRPHVPSQGELLINCNISSSTTTTTNITNVCPPDQMGDGWLRKCWCLDLLSLHHLRHPAYDGRQTQIRPQPGKY